MVTSSDYLRPEQFCIQSKLKRSHIVSQRQRQLANLAGPYVPGAIQVQWVSPDTSETA
jgi:hypothetical protein